MRTVKIPETMNPFIVAVGGVVYSYEAGATESVPDAVADVIDNINALLPREAKEQGNVGDVLTRLEQGGSAFEAPVKELPNNGFPGMFLMMTSDGPSWELVPPATKTAKGIVTMGASVDHVTGTTASAAITAINALLTSLENAGIIDKPAEATT